ncbi:MAG: hypothetical protein FWE08_07220 [Oscillospiraceae bacterium]|nr:hypothetical protein [Oscillospiraceae bacterium]
MNMLSPELTDGIRAIFGQETAWKNVWIFEQIPQKKLRNAIRSYASNMGHDETVLVLYDDTVFGSSKEGFILTTRRLYGKNLMESGSFVEAADIINMTFEPGGSAPEAIAHTRTGVLRKHLIVSNSSKQAETLFNALQQAIALLNPSMESSRQAVSAPAAPQQAALCEGCGAVGHTAVCEYCGRPLR